MYRIKIILRSMGTRKKNILYFMTIMGLFALLLSASMTILTDLSKGISLTSEKMGAGCMITSVSDNNVYEDVILSAGSTQSYLDRSICDILDKNNIPYTYQIYLKSLQASCCSVVTQIIGYQPETDFIVSPWIKSYTTNTKGVVIGYSTGFEGDIISLFGTEYPILAELDETGSGLDRSVYVPMEMVEDMWHDSIEKGAKYTYTDINKIVSVILLQDEYADKAQEVLKNEKVSFIFPGKMVNDMENSLKGMKELTLTFIIIFGILTGVALGAMTSLTLDSRRKEFSILRLTGISMRNISYNLIIENLFISLLGSFIGSGLGLWLISILSDRLVKTFNIPYVKDIDFNNGFIAMLIPIGIYMFITCIFIISLSKKNYLKEYQSFV